MNTEQRARFDAGLARAAAWAREQQSSDAAKRRARLEDDWRRELEFSMSMERAQ